MELLIRLIEFLVRSALEPNKPPTTGAPPIAAGARLPTAAERAAVQQQAAAQRMPAPLAQPQRAPVRPQAVPSSAARKPAPGHTHSTQSSSAPLMAMRQAAAQDPAYDDGGWRTAVLIFALIALAILVIMWLAAVG